MAKGPALGERQRLSEDVVAQIRSLGVKTNLMPDAVLFAQSTTGEHIYYLEEGVLKLSWVTADGGEKIARYMSAGNIVGLAGILVGKPYGITATAVTKAVLWKLHHEHFLALALENPSVSLFGMQLLGDLIWNLRRQTQSLSFDDCHGKVASTLLYMAGAARPLDGPLRLKIQQEELARLVGANRVTVSRILSDFRKIGAIRTRPGIIDIDDRALLQRFVQYDPIV